MAEAVARTRVSDNLSFKLLKAKDRDPNKTVEEQLEELPRLTAAQASEATKSE